MPTPTDPVSVTLALGAAPYQKTLAAKLLSARMLRQVLEFVPYLEIREPNERATLETVRSFPAYTLLKRVVWGMWRRLPAAVQPRPPVTATAWLADRLVSKQIAHCKIFHGCTALCSGELARHQEKWRDHAGGERGVPSAALEESGDGRVPAIWRAQR